jgi:hypothetical protein
LELLPPDFMEKAAKGEAWDKRDRQECDALCENLEGLGVASIRLNGPMLVAKGDFPSGGIVPFPTGASKPTLDALRTLVHQLLPGPLGPADAAGKIRR